MLKLVLPNKPDQPAPPLTPILNPESQPDPPLLETRRDQPNSTCFLTLKPPDQDHDILDKIIRAFSGAIKQNPHTKNLKEEDLDSHLSLYLTPEQSETRVIMLGFCLSLILLAACSILTSMGIYQRLQDDDQKFTIQKKHTESKRYTILVITLPSFFLF